MNENLLEQLGALRATLVSMLQQLDALMASLATESAPEARSRSPPERRRLPSLKAWLEDTPPHRPNTDASQSSGRGKEDSQYH